MRIEYMKVQRIIRVTNLLIIRATRMEKYESKLNSRKRKLIPKK
jgi:hypothetical protein